VCLVARPTGVDEVNNIFREEAPSIRYRDTGGMSDEAGDLFKVMSLTPSGDAPLALRGE